ncbi:DUF86 domain-containing protein [Virgibacillus oceani]|uniref:DUF86 domain-containing protein n=1 Tax=Virgibacillus oceani TaxID=1479511 RepID=A0A917H443_9BACI|nr:DUF86 domain-containing protein [Virgibacillus oceani]GGG66408.1 hypothetical protein GCM10011398_07540 [Virgibacillus oceani]
MYFVDRSKIEQTLLYMEGLLQELGNSSLDSYMEKLGLERITQMLIESMLDVGNMMIDGFIMRDPGSFDDIIDILIDEKVLPKEDEESYKSILHLRKNVVKEYLEIDHTLLKQTIIENRHVLDAFGNRIRSYLNNELGVANAFSNE